MEPDYQNAISVLDENWIYFKKWLQNHIDKRGVGSTLTLGQIADGGRIYRWFGEGAG